MQLSSLSASGSFVFFQKLGCRLLFVILPLHSNACKFKWNCHNLKSLNAVCKVLPIKQLTQFFNKGKLANVVYSLVASNHLYLV